MKVQDSHWRKWKGRLNQENCEKDMDGFNSEGWDGTKPHHPSLLSCAIVKLRGKVSMWCKKSCNFMDRTKESKRNNAFENEKDGKWESMVGEGFNWANLHSTPWKLRLYSVETRIFNTEIIDFTKRSVFTPLDMVHICYTLYVLISSPLLAKLLYENLHIVVTLITDENRVTQ